MRMCVRQRRNGKRKNWIALKTGCPGSCRLGATQNPSRVGWRTHRLCEGKPLPMPSASAAI